MWAAHREGAALLILCAIGHLVSTWPWRRPVPGEAVLAEGGAPARAELRARLRVATACAVLSGELYSSVLLPGRPDQALTGLHTLAGVATAVLLGGMGLVGANTSPTPARGGPALPRSPLVRAGMYLGGCVSFSLGVKLFIDSGLGTDPLTSMALGVSGRLHVAGVRVGAVTGAATLTMLGLWCRWGRRPPPLSTFLTMAS